MRSLLARLVATVLSVASATAWAQASGDNATMVDDMNYCYALAATANMTVLQRNAGKTLEEQLDRRKASLGADTPEYKLMEQIAQQIYAKDLKNPVAAAIDTHASCLDAKGRLNQFTGNVLQRCPAVGVLVAEVAAARRAGATVEQVIGLVGERYGSLAKTHEGGVEKLATRYTEASKPENGSGDYMLCMALGVK